MANVVLPVRVKVNVLESDASVDAVFETTVSATGNIFVEYESRNKRSGIATSEAFYYCYWLSNYHFIMIEKDELKKLCRKYIGTERDVLGGDSNTSKGILLPLHEFFQK